MKYINYNEISRKRNHPHILQPSTYTTIIPKQNDNAAIKHYSNQTPISL